MSKPTRNQTIIGLVISVLTAVSGFLGYEKYEASQAAGSQTVEVHIESVPDNMQLHAHGEVVSRDTIKALIKEALEAQDEKNSEIFKLKEPWDE